MLRSANIIVSTSEPDLLRYYATTRTELVPLITRAARLRDQIERNMAVGWFKGFMGFGGYDLAPQTATGDPIAADMAGMQFAGYDKAAAYLVLGMPTSNNKQQPLYDLFGLTAEERAALPEAHLSFLVVKVSGGRKQRKAVIVLATGEHLWVDDGYKIDSPYRNELLDHAVPAS